MLSGLSGLSGLSAVCGGAVAFSPTTLTGYVNSPYNIALLRSQGKLWQDTAMTVPATADGDPVRRIDCGGTYYDAPSDAARPLLWDEGGGKWSLSFDGVDDCFAVSNQVLGTNWSVGMAWRRSVAVTDSIEYLIGSSLGGCSVAGIGYPQVLAYNGWFLRSDWTPTNNVSHVAVIDGSHIYKESPPAETGYTQTDTIASFTADRFGCRYTGDNAYFFTGRCYGIALLSAVPSSIQRANLAAYLAALAP